jgi:hypothetical protein
MEESRSAHPFPGLVVVLDIRGFGGLTNPEKLVARNQLYALVAKAFEDAGLRWDDCAHEDRGDGIVVVLPAIVPKPLVMGPVLSGLIRGVAQAPPLNQVWTMAVRIAAHAAEIHRDDNGFAGSDVDLAFRLVDSPVLREALDRAPSRCVVLVSDALHQSTVRHRYPGMDERVFHQVPVSVKETSTTGWLHIPGDDRTAREVAAAHREPVTPSPPAHTTQMQVGGDITANSGVVANGQVTIGSAPRRSWWRRGEGTR